MHKIFSSGLIITFLLFAGAAQSAEIQLSGPLASTGMAHQDFGRIRSDSKVQHIFELKNLGTQPLQIKNVSMSGQGIKSRLPSKVAAGEIAEIVVSIDASELAGDWGWELRFETNDVNHPVVSYTLTASVYQTIEFIPSRTIFFSLFDDQSSTNQITITNHAKEPLQISSLERSVDLFKAVLMTNEPGRQFTLEITVPKKLKPGRYRESVVLHTNSPERSSLHVPVNILIKNDLYPSPEFVSFGLLNKDRIQNNPSVLEFLTQTVLLTNRNDMFSITDISTGLPFITIQKTPSQQSKVFRIDIGLDPATLTRGRFSDVIKIQTEDPSFPEILIPVSGEVH